MALPTQVDAIAHRVDVASEGHLGAAVLVGVAPDHTREQAMKTAEMMNSYPADINLDRDLLARTIDTLVACAQACTACADACLSEETVAELRKCIRTD
ncbi:hypothetical protein [Enemella sp. A6]|uniref:hypothetical protein n=1 Tax=Enemella sp. A6 TaxID=3440152 RepID=UPI003EB89AD3